MANLSLTTTRTSPSGSVNRNKDFSDADLDRLHAAAITALQEQGIPNPTTGQVADYIFARLVADLKTFTRNQETAASSKAIGSIGL